MENIDFDAARRLIGDWEQSSLGRSLGILAQLAEIGFEQLNQPAPPDPDSDEPASCARAAISPRRAAEYCGVSWKTLRDNWVRAYGIKSFGTGRSRRFRVAELDRVLRMREDQSVGQPVQNR